MNVIEKEVGDLFLIERKSMPFWLARKLKGKIDETILCVSEEERELFKKKDLSLINISEEEHREWKNEQMRKQHLSSVH